MRYGILFSLGTMVFAFEVAAQTAVDVVRPEEQQKARRAVVKEQEKRAKRTNIIEFRGEQAFKEKDLRVALKEEITTVEDFGLSPARADDLAFFLEVFYRKHGYAKVDVHYVIESGDRLRLDINEGPRFLLSQVSFDGNAHEPPDKLFEYLVGPTRERYSRMEKRLPFVAADLEEGTHLVGQTVYGSEALRGQISDLLQRPYTEVRVEDIPRRLEAYFKARGYYDVKVAADGAPDEEVNGRVPVHIVVSPGAVYHFDGVTVTGLRRLHPSFVTKRFTRLEGKTYSPDVLDERFRTLMKTGQFNLLQIKPVPVDGHLLRLDISAEEAKSKEFGFWGGFDTYEGALAGVQVGDRDLFGYGRPLTATIEVSQRSYRGEILYEDPFFFDTDFVFTARVFALTFDYDGYTKFEVGGRFELSRKITKYDEASLTFSARHVDITDSVISNLSAVRCELVTIFHLDPNRSRRVLLKINPQALLFSVGSANRQSRSVRAAALFIRSPTAAPTRQLRFPSTNVFLTAAPQRYAVSASANSARTIITVIRSAANFLRSSTWNTHSRFSANCRARCLLTLGICCRPPRTLG